jgi:flagellar protein FliT
MPKHTAKPLTAAAHAAPTTTDRIMNTQLLSYYEAIEQASADMLSAARSGNWDEVVKLEGACVLLISQLKHAASQQQLGPDETQLKTRIMQRILVNDAEIRHLAEPWLEDLDHLMKGKSKTVH